MPDRWALAVENHDHPACERCGTPTWRGDMVLHWDAGGLVCLACVEDLDVEADPTLTP